MNSQLRERLNFADKNGISDPEKIYKIISWMNRLNTKDDKIKNFPYKITREEKISGCVAFLNLSYGQAIEFVNLLEY